MKSRSLLITLVSLTFSLSLVIRVFGQVDGGTMQVDHIILAISDLESGMKEFQELTGVKPQFGGVHPANDTQNAIIVLEGGKYLEILAPIDDLDTVPEFFKDFNQLALIGFAISTNNIESLAERVKQLGYESNGIESGSRKTPQGQLLEWQLMLLNEPPLYINPFFTSWSGNSSHPSSSQPVLCDIEELELVTPHLDDIQQILNKQSVLSEIKMSKGDFSLHLRLNTPKGVISFGS